MSNLIDNPLELLDMSRDELDELLLEKYKSTALLRELLRRTLRCLNSANNLNKVYKKKITKQEEKILNIKNQLLNISQD